MFDCSLKMRFILFVICVRFLLPVQPDDTERYFHCESCLTVAQEIEKVMMEAPAESRQTVAEGLINGGVCEKLLSFRHGHVPKDRIVSSCMHLLESHYDQFHAVLINREPKHLDIVLCYELSIACVGVKRQSFEDTKKTTFTEGDIEALLWDNKERVRIADPVHSDSPVHSKEEL
ncbi:uncharacterized protein V6R79_020149 [Siganus canaliculatus]